MSQHRQRRRRRRPSDLREPFQAGEPEPKTPAWERKLERRAVRHGWPMSDAVFGAVMGHMIEIALDPDRENTREAMTAARILIEADARQQRTIGLGMFEHRDTQ